MNKKLSFNKVYDDKLPFSNRKLIREEYKKIMGISNKVFYDHKKVGYKYSPIEKTAVEEIFRKQGFDQEIWEAVEN